MKQKIIKNRNPLFIQKKHSEDWGFEPGDFDKNAIKKRPGSTGSQMAETS